MMIVVLLIGLMAGLAAYGGCFLAAYLLTESRGLRLRRGFYMLIGTAAFCCLGDALLMHVRGIDEPGGALFLTIPFVIACLTGAVIGLHLLLGGPRGDYMP
jgi:hypothetical protein